jgi:hypothetical protein
MQELLLQEEEEEEPRLRADPCPSGGATLRIQGCQIKMQINSILKKLARRLRDLEGSRFPAARGYRAVTTNAPGARRRLE